MARKPRGPAQASVVRMLGAGHSVRVETGKRIRTMPSDEENGGHTASGGGGPVSYSAPAKTEGLDSVFSSSSALEMHLLLSIRAAGLPEPVREHRFAPPRMWRIDFCWPKQWLAVEVEGGIYRGGGHTSVDGLKRDIEKSNALTMAGWRLLRFHGDQVRSGEATELIRQALEAS